MILLSNAPFVPVTPGSSRPVAPLGSDYLTETRGTGEEAYIAVKKQVMGLNYGIDFKGGYIFEVRMPEVPNISELRDKLSSLHLGEVALQQFGADKDILIKVRTWITEKLRLLVQK
eukprot:gene15948-16114_t